MNKELLQQALDALMNSSSFVFIDVSKGHLRQEAIGALQAAIAQPAVKFKLLTEHSGCGHGTQVDQLTVKLNPGDKVMLVMGKYSSAIDKALTSKEIT